MGLLLIDPIIYKRLSFKRWNPMIKISDTSTDIKIKKTKDTHNLAFVNDFPIVGIGASAGGLEALEQFLKCVPLDSGIAFVVVQHLDPNHKNIMTELLQRVTKLKVQQITARVVVRPNNVYLIPPAYDLTILNGVLLLLKRSEPHGLHLPIDYFFCSLAADKKERSIGVILSGMGSDGTLGLRKIKDEGGAGFVQSPQSAKFEGMPNSAIDAGLANSVVPADKLVGVIIDYITYFKLRSEKYNKHHTNLEQVIALLRAHTGHDFSHYKKNTFRRCMERRMSMHQLADVEGYVAHLRANPQENELLFKELLIGVTSFFRDKSVWEQLKIDVIPLILSRYPKGGILRAWIPACSTGEEAYSLAIVFQEALKKLNPTERYELMIFATDIDKDAIEIARKASYLNKITDDVPKDILGQYFEKIKGGYRISKRTREMVIFAQQNLIMDPPFTKLDIISCRNLLIYLENALQRRLIPLFHYSLKSSGILILGMSETIGEDEELFTSFKGKHRIYVKDKNMTIENLITFPISASGKPSHELAVDRFLPRTHESSDVMNLSELTFSLLQEYFTPVALLTTTKADILYIHGKTGQYLEPAVGKINYNLFAMAREGLLEPLKQLFHRAIRQNKQLELKNITIIDNDNGNGNNRQVDIKVKPLSDANSLQGLVFVLFNISIAQIPSKTKSISKDEEDELTLLKNVLQDAREELQITTNEMQFAQENLKSTNEELQSTNEELQSTNEELRTSKEEMQSMNEELQTVNNELSGKVSELSEASNDMENLLNSTNIATLFLDKDLKVRRFTNEIHNIFKLIVTDVGRPITDLVSSLIYPRLADDAKSVLDSLIFHEEEVTTLDGRWYSIRIMPYRTQENVIDGIVITFTDDTLNAKVNIAMAESESRFRLLFENSSNAVAYKRIIMKEDKAVDFNYLEANKAYSVITGLHNVIGRKGSEVMPNILEDNSDFLSACGRVAMFGKSETIEYYVKETEHWYVCSMYSQEKNLFICVTENITHKKKNIETLNDMKMKLDHQMSTSEKELENLLVNIRNMLDKLVV